MIGRDLLGAETLTEVYFNLSAFFSIVNFAVQFNKISFKEPFAVHTWLPHCESYFSVWVSHSHGLLILSGAMLPEPISLVCLHLCLCIIITNKIHAFYTHTHTF